MPLAVEEILRWTTATLYNRRTATIDTEIDGRRIAEGDKVTLWWPSANRDESVFEDPFRFEIRRDPNPHLTFGHRTHFCLGANLARMEIRVILEEVLDRLEDFELIGPVKRVRTNKHAASAVFPCGLEPEPPVDDEKASGPCARIDRASPISPSRCTVYSGQKLHRARIGHR